MKVNEKSNEIVAIPTLLDMMSIEGAVVTIDAMGCQRNIAGIKWTLYSSPSPSVRSSR